MLSTAVKKAIRYLPERLMLRTGRQFSVDGLRLVVFGQDRNRAEALKAKITSALQLVQQHSPKNYARIRRFIPNILIFDGHRYNAVYLSELKLCHIARGYALADQTTPVRLGMTLVHEATHGYLDSRRIKYEEPLRARIERICTRTEIAFARKLPDSDDLVAAEAEVLNTSPEYWTNEAFFERDVKGLETLGAPRWLVRYFRKRRKKQLQQRRPLN